VACRFLRLALAAGLSSAGLAGSRRLGPVGLGADVGLTGAPGATEYISTSAADGVSTIAVRRSHGRCRRGFHEIHSLCGHVK
jgi:hypothetical protein